MLEQVLRHMNTNLEFPSRFKRDISYEYEGI